jgi:preprotein translocase subunit SecF
MDIFPQNVVFNFMRWRKPALLLSVAFVVTAIGLILGGHPKLGTDFVGGTEVEVDFKQPVAPDAIRQAVRGAGFSQPDVIRVAEGGGDRFIIRVKEVATLDADTQAQIGRLLCFGEGLSDDACPESRRAAELKFSPGGDKISLRFRQPPDLDWVRAQALLVPGIKLREGQNNPRLESARDNKVELQLMSKGDQLLGGLTSHLGADKVGPESLLRVEWIGPRAGALLRESAIRSLAIALVGILIYLAFRFDLRFAPGAVVALIHDSIATIGVLVLTGKELNLTTVAAILTVVGYSVNDTVIVYDRVRENLGKLRGSSFTHLINVSLSEMMSRTVLTSGTTILSLMAFFVWGTGVLKDFSFTLITGIVLGTYSSIYVALPLSEFLDRRFFSKVGKGAAKARARVAAAEASHQA